ncbi:phosphatidylinositol 4,5-bisphosphate 5-phosphatase A-like isoform X2 [Ctenocephalides felis]|uniref:phosphatidylinositol 4,5-bisphosphate 5-phosphatase A-like isoform X2 n=1 Tax=Ctenocephalides felis TaxID=7515 RepID=UPI000E6E1AC8|nr:phosphatidylinositol 4,5-bisphosphate 5-phosphatase A-like isoform X2 [Ctenocephalides felis]
MLYHYKLLNLFVYLVLTLFAMSAAEVPLKFHFVTYNVGTGSPEQDLHKLLQVSKNSKDDENKFDFYVIGLQEVKAQIQNIVMDAIFEDPWTNAIKSILEIRDFVKVKTIRLQGLVLNIFCLRKHLLSLRYIETQYTRTGLGGMWGNKGAVSIRFSYHGSSMCFVNAHLTAHDHMQSDRIDDYHDIIKENKFSPKLVESILDHDYVFWIGDLNFRLMDEDSTSAEYIADEVSKNHLSKLYEMDQLNNARIKGEAFKEFTEQTPNFKPTFKYVVGTHHDYDMKRRPAWTDRIMYKVKNHTSENKKLKFEQLSYRSHEGYTISDHKPVSSNFLIPVSELKEEAQVKFASIALWKLDKENKVEYTINPGVEISFEDWIGVYKDEFNSLDEYKEYMYVRNGNIVDTANGHSSSNSEITAPKCCNILFPDTSLHSAGMYRLIYFGVQDGSTSILGMSEAFPARKED